MMNRRPQKMSVILTTYNHPRWLEKVLWAYSCQQYKGFEVVIADDGSDAPTQKVVEAAQKESSMDIRHVWHADEGFRKCEILNRAIEAATGDYLVFSDGDCVPRRDFLTHHFEMATPGRFLSGGYFKLPMELSRQMDRRSIQSGEAFTLRYLRAGGVKRSRRDLRVITRGRFAKLCNVLTPTRATWNGNNSSGWKDDIVRVGGFDERMRYGGLDRELGERLENAGVRGRHLRYQTLVLHLDHARGYANPEDLANNRRIRHETRSSGRTFTDYGLRPAA